MCHIGTHFDLKTIESKPHIVVGLGSAVFVGEENKCLAIRLQNSVRGLFHTALEIFLPFAFFSLDCAEFGPHLCYNKGIADFAEWCANGSQNFQLRATIQIYDAEMIV